MGTYSEPRDFTKDVIEGATKGVLSWSKEEVTALASKLRNKELAFIGDIDTIRIVKEQLKTGEWDISSKYVDDHELRILIQMGLTLRKLELEHEYDRLQDLRTKILSKYNPSGLHIAQFVQRRILTSYLATAMPKISSVSELKSTINEMLKNVDKYVIFIQGEDKEKIKNVVDKIITRIYAHRPKTFIIFSKHSTVPISAKVIKLLRKKISDYSIEQHVSDIGDSIYFLNEIETD